MIIASYTIIDRIVHAESDGSVRADDIPGSARVYEPLNGEPDRGNASGAHGGTEIHQGGH